MKNVYLVTSCGMAGNAKFVLAESAKEAIIKWENQSTDTRQNCNIAGEVKLIANDVIL